MNANLPSREQIHNPEDYSHRQTSYTTLTVEGQQYRVLQREFQCHRAIFSVWAVFWSFVTFTLALLLFCRIDQTGPIPILSLFVACTLIQTIYCFVQRRNVSQMMFVWPLSCLLFALSLCIMLACRIQLTIVPCSLFSLFLIIFAAMNTQQKGRIVMLLVFLTQISLVAAKADGLTEMNWTLVLIPLLPFALFSISSLVFLLVYLLVLKIYYPDNYQSKKYNLIFLVISISGISCLQSVVLGWIYLDLSLTLIAGIALCGTSMIALNLWIFTNQFSLAFCRHKEKIIDGQKQLRVDLIPKNDSEIPQLYRYSSTWFGKQARKPQQTVSCFDAPECIICTQQNSEMVWLPCGHLSLCSPCTEDVLASQMINCVLCKQRPQQIGRIVFRSPMEVKIEKEMGLPIIEEDQLKYTLSALYEVREYL